MKRGRKNEENVKEKRRKKKEERGKKETWVSKRAK
jgi:hypothetical protein